MSRRPCWGAPLAVWLVGLMTTGCGDGETEPGPPTGGDRCGPGQVPYDSERCCPAGALVTPEGACLPAGVPAAVCAEGFVPAAGGCDPILPSEPCPSGEMAIPGDEVCRPVADCGEGPWGSIAAEAGTVFVDGAYAGGGNGSEQQPFLTIQAGIDGAAPGAIVAVAAGSYGEDLHIGEKPVRLWGRCPSMVEIIGTGARPAVVRIARGADTAVVRGVAVTGPAHGIAVTAAQQVSLQQLWVHDTAGRGVIVQDDYGETGVLIDGVLVERAAALGVFTWGSTLALTDTVIRDGVPLTDGTEGVGLVAMANPLTGRRAVVTADHLVLERHHGMGAFAEGADLHLNGSVVRDIRLPSNPAQVGAAVSAEVEPETGERGRLVIASSVVENVAVVGVLAQGGDASLDGVTIRDVLPLGDGSGGFGLSVENDAPSGERSLASVQRTLIERTRVVGALFLGAEATLESTLIRDVLPRAADQQLGRGLAIQADPALGHRASVTVRGVAIERAHDVGLFVDGSDGIVESTRVCDIAPQPFDGRYGRGVQVQPDLVTAQPATLTLRHSVVELSYETGVAVAGSEATIEATVVRNTRARDLDDLFGDGVAVVYVAGLASHADLRGLLVQDNPRAGVVTFGGAVDLSQSQLLCNGLQLVAEAHGGQEALFADGGGNGCGCAGVAEPCRVLSASLTPPEATTSN